MVTEALENLTYSIQMLLKGITYYNNIVQIDVAYCIAQIIE